MELAEIVKKSWKKVIIAGTLLGALALGSGCARTYAPLNIGNMPQPPQAVSVASPIPEGKASAEPKPDKRKYAERQLVFDFADPMSDFDALTKARYSAGELIGRLGDMAANKTDNKLVGRLAQLGALYWLTHGADHFAHEIAHGQNSKRQGFGGTRFTFEQFSRMGYPKVRHNATPVWLGPDLYIFELAAGLNEQADYVNFLASHTQKEGRINIDEAIAFLANKLRNTTYSTIGKDDSSRVGGIGFDDIDMYLAMLHDWKGKKMSKGELLTQSLLSDILSMQTWDSIRGIKRYLVNRERSINHSTIKFGKTEISYPLINLYLTSDGTFYNATGFVNPRNKNPIKFEIGAGIGPAGADCTRFGAQYHGLRPGGKNSGFEISPFVYLTTGQETGVSAGAEFAYEKGSRRKVKLTGRIEYNDRDLLENSVKGKREGITARFGAEVKF